MKNYRDFTLKVQYPTILHYGFPSYKKRLEKRKVVKNALELVPLDDEL